MRTSPRMARGRRIAAAMAPATPALQRRAAVLLPRQPLPTAVLHPERTALKLGLDVHLEFIMAVAQRGHVSPQAPRKFTPDPLVVQVQKWVAEGLVVYGVQ